LDRISEKKNKIKESVDNVAKESIVHCSIVAMQQETFLKFTINYLKRIQT